MWGFRTSPIVEDSGGTSLRVHLGYLLASINVHLPTCGECPPKTGAAIRLDAEKLKISPATLVPNDVISILPARHPRQPQSYRTYHFVCGDVSLLSRELQEGTNLVVVQLSPGLVIHELTRHGTTRDVDKDHFLCHYVKFDIISYHLVPSTYNMPPHPSCTIRSCLKKNQNTPRPSEHPPVRWGKMSKRLGGIKGCKYKTSSWHLNGFPDGNNIGSTV